jgi:hypothetical protein
MDRCDLWLRPLRVVDVVTALAATCCVIVFIRSAAVLI